MGMTNLYSFEECTIEGCIRTDIKHAALGYCGLHKDRYYRGNDLYAPLKKDRIKVRRYDDNGTEYKECLHCENWLPISEFYTSVPGNHICKECTRERVRARRSKLSKQKSQPVLFKVCRHCGELKEITDFYKDSTADGYSYRCRICIGLERVTYYQNNQHMIKLQHYRRKERLLVDMTIDDELATASHLAKIRNDDCFYCGVTSEHMHNDHIIPLAKGGTNHWWNLVRACEHCNETKHTMDIDDFIPHDPELEVCEIG